MHCSLKEETKYRKQKSHKIDLQFRGEEYLQQHQEKEVADELHDSLLLAEQ